MPEKSLSRELHIGCPLARSRCRSEWDVAREILCAFDQIHFRPFNVCDEAHGLSMRWHRKRACQTQTASSLTGSFPLPRLLTREHRVGNAQQRSKIIEPRLGCDRVDVPMGVPKRHQHKTEPRS